MKNEFLLKVINQLKKNQQFPKYQLERRLDIFINTFLPEIIQWKFGSEYHVDFIIPELPIKKDGNYQSTNLDYFAACNSQNKGFLVELKTDPHSCRADQFNLYLKVQKNGFGKIIKDIRTIKDSPHNRYRKKYEYLLSVLESGKVDLNIDLEIIYILPEAGIQRLSKNLQDSNQTVHFITLESLRSSIVTSSFQEEWDIIWSSNLF
jgi:hypothetical protein